MNKEIYASDLAIQHGATLIKTNNSTIEYLKKYFEEKDYFFAFFDFKNHVLHLHQFCIFQKYTQFPPSHQNLKVHNF
mgnify:CR=1 FL=1